MKATIRKMIEQAAADLTAERVDFSLETPPAPIRADLSTNVALLLAKPLRRRPADIAKLIIGPLEKSPLLAKVDFAPPGFINLTLADSYLQNTVNYIRQNAQTYGESKQQRKRYLLEYVSANPTGPLHIGHGRWAVIGSALSNILQACGQKVESEFYVNDAGRQIDLLVRSVRARQRGEILPEDGYQGEYVRELAEKTKNIPADKLARHLIELILAEQKHDLAAIRVKFDRFFFESVLHQKGAVRKAIEELKQKGFTYEKDGALWFSSEKLGDDKDRVLVRENGEETYFAADIAYHLHKLERKCDKLINIWGTDHHGYISRIKAVIAALGYDPKEKLEIIIGQLVSLYRGGEPVKLSKRAGNVITLAEVVEEIGSDAARFYLTMRGVDTHLDFDLELAKKHSDENPVFYVQYAHARICSILRKAQESSRRIGKAETALLADPSERALMRRLWDYPNEVQLAAERYQPHRITQYLREVARLLHAFYHQCRVISDEAKLSEARLALVDASRIVLKNALSLLSITAPERM